MTANDGDASATGGGDTLAALRRGDLAGARELRFDGTLAAVPDEVLALADTLEVLDLGRGTLTDLPAGMARLHRLRVLFLSGHRFARLPPVLGDCAALRQIGCRGTGLRDVPGEALPPRLRWLTLTDNAIETLPEALGARPELQKLMLAGNRLTALPASLAGADRLELVRLAANRFAALPPWLAALPRLAWAAWAGNPADAAAEPADPALVPWRDLAPGPQLGEGASGRVHAALWHDPAAAAPRRVAVKLFKGAMTSDGLPDREMAAALLAGDHPHLAGALGRIAGHPEGAAGLVMPLLPAGWRALAGPPSLASCTRDVYDPALRLTPAVALRLAGGIAAAAAHLHARGLMHGDLYAHNILWDGATGAGALTDFGAASGLPPGAAGAAWRRVEVRAFGLLLGEVLDRCGAVAPALHGLVAACTGPARERPAMAEVADRLSADAVAP